MAGNSSFDCAASSLLLCTEESKSLCFDDDPLVDQPLNDQPFQASGKHNKDMSFINGRSEPFIALPCLTEENIGLMAEREKGHLPRDDYLSRLRKGDLDLSLRREALDWISKAHAHCGFGAVTLSLSVNYLDRFLSFYDLPRGKTWAIQLLAVTCLSLAAKMEEIEVPPSVDLQVGEPKFMFEGKTIQRMELLVLTTLKWRMQAYTPFNFIDYFLRKMNGDELPSRAMITGTIQLILSTIKGIDFLEFKPSEIAAGVAMSVSGEIQAMDIDKALSCFIGVEKDRVLKCFELVQNLTSFGGVSSSSSSSISANMLAAASFPQSPNGVLEAACLSYRSDGRTVGSCPNSSHTSPHTKRRKLDTTTPSSTLGADP